MSQCLLADWYIACITFHNFFFVLFFFLDFWNFPSQDIDFWYRSCKSRQCLLNIKSNICCKKYILFFLIRHESGKKCTDHEILLVLKVDLTYSWVFLQPGTKKNLQLIHLPFCLSDNSVHRNWSLVRKKWEFLKLAELILNL